MAYTKLFSSIVTSTIWTEADRTRIVWITMLATADANGEVQASIPGLARIAGVPVEDCRAAIAVFLAPDPDSRTKDDGGRRIEAIDGGWQLLNYRKYRDMATDDDRKRKAAIRQQRVRDKKARNNHNSHASVTPKSHQIPHAEAEADVLLEKEPKGAPRRKEPDEADFALACNIGLDLTAAAPLRLAWHEWQTYRQRRHTERGTGRLKWTAQAARLSAGQVQRAAEAHGAQIVTDRIATAIAGHWQGLNFDKLTTHQNGNHPHGTPRPATVITRNTATLPPNRPSLNDTDWRPAAGVPDPERPSP